MKITKKWLVTHNACFGDLERFQTVFPRGANITHANVIKAVEAGLDLEWLAEHLFHKEVWDAYDSACAPFDDDYRTKKIPILVAYDKARQRLNKQKLTIEEVVERSAEIASIRDALMAPLRKACKLGCAEAFWRTYENNSGLVG